MTTNDHPLWEVTTGDLAASTRAQALALAAALQLVQTGVNSDDAFASATVIHEQLNFVWDLFVKKMEGTS